MMNKRRHRLHTRKDNGDVCLSPCWTLVNAAFLLEINGPILFCSFLILYLELENAVGLVEKGKRSAIQSRVEFYQ